MKLLNPIAIIGAGCVLPGSGNVEDFWKVLISGNQQFRNLNQERWTQSIFFSPNSKEPHTTYSAQGAYVHDSLFMDSHSNLPRTHQMLKKALDEAIIPFGTNFFAGKKTAVILGCMNPGDESSESLIKAKSETLKKDLKKKGFKNLKDQQGLESFFETSFGNASSDPKVHYPSSLAQWVHNYLGTQGLSFCADSACASSLTAIDLATQLLEEKEADIVITGGVESNLGLETYIPFARLGVLARQFCLPYDEKSEGIVQGEGSVIFILQRNEEALKFSNPIWGLIEGITSSSNGSKASLFSPSLESQKRIFKELNTEMESLPPFYVEGHGTGTPVGDLAELTALQESFSDSTHPIYLGSVKSLIGHTKGTAGAAGVLKCLLAIKNRTIPPSTYFSKPIADGEINPVCINSTKVAIPISKEPLQMRVCSAGFGGSNYHLSLREFRLSEQTKKQDKKNETQNRKSQSLDVCLIAQSKVPFYFQSEKISLHNWKIPPNILNSLDPSQISGLLALEDALDRSLLSLDVFNKNKITVISASHMRTHKIENLTTSLQLKRLALFLKPESIEDIDAVENLRKSLGPLDETCCQCLNSMTSGRIANEYDLQGPNFHIDADYASQGYALKLAQLLISRNHSEAVVVISSQEAAETNPILIKRLSISCEVLTKLELAQQKSLPILATLKEVSFSQ